LFHPSSSWLALRHVTAWFRTYDPVPPAALGMSIEDEAPADPSHVVIVERDQVLRRRRKHGFLLLGGSSGEKLIPSSSSTSTDLNFNEDDVEEGFSSQPELGSEAPEEDLGVDRKFFRRFYTIHKILFLSLNSIASTLFAFLMALCLLGELNRT
jgi:hypothetical protein